MLFEGLKIRLDARQTLKQKSLNLETTSENKEDLNKIEMAIYKDHYFYKVLIDYHLYHKKILIHQYFHHMEFPNMLSNIYLYNILLLAF